MKHLTIVVPVYDEEESLVPFLNETSKVLESLKETEASFLFVNDGSKDRTLAELRRLSKERQDVEYLSFSRNFGKEAAIFAGLSHAEGEYVILMDGDLQHPPALIPKMLEAVAEEGFQAAGAKRKPGLFSRLFTGLNNKVSTVKLEKGATDYMCMSRQYVDAVLLLCENQRFSKGLFSWVGFDVKWFTYEQGPRYAGKSKWGPFRLFSYAADGITSFSILPLKIVSVIGGIICVLSFLYILITLIQTWIFGIDVPGYVTTLIMILFLGGVIILSIGILGAYIGRIYLETKERPLYILQEKSLKESRGKEKPEEPSSGGES